MALSASGRERGREKPGRSFEFVVSGPSDRRRKGCGHVKGRLNGIRFDSIETYQSRRGGGPTFFGMTLEFGRFPQAIFPKLHRFDRDPSLFLSYLLRAYRGQLFDPRSFDVNALLIVSLSLSEERKKRGRGSSFERFARA